MIRPLLREARPKQWAKNVLVFAGPGAAGVLDEGGALGRTLIAFAAFCLAASGTYFWNDLLDVEADRAHPTKSRRPIASGAVSIAVGRVVGSASLLAGMGLGFAVGWKCGLAVIAYVALTLSYSAIWKHIAVLDLLAVAGGFVLRAVGGAVAADVPMSSWFVLCTTFGAMFIVTGKRYAELRDMGEDAGTTRVILTAYTLPYLRQVLTVSCGASMVAYSIWAFEVNQIRDPDWPFYQLSIVPVVAALLRYLLVLEQGHGGAPEEVFLADRGLQLLGLVWLVVFGLGVYAG